MDSKAHSFGKHYLVELIGCNADLLRMVETVRPVFLEAVRQSNATVIAVHFHQFEPQGVTGMVFIAESHFSIHTWPESGYAAVDILTCGVMEPEKAIAWLRKTFQAQQADIRIMERGF